MSKRHDDGFTMDTEDWKVPTTDKVPCPRCQGSGQIADANHPPGSAAGPNFIECPDCKGTGKVEKK